MKTDKNLYMNYMKNIEVGEIYFVDARNYSSDFCVEQFYIEPIPTTILENIINNGVLSYPFIYTPLMFVSNENISKSEITLNYETYIYNNSPLYAAINLKSTNNYVKIPISTTNFSSVKGAFISNEVMNDYEITYYGIVVTKENKESICRFASQQERDEYNGIYCIYDYYGKNIDTHSEDNSYIQIASTFTLWTVSFLSVILFINYGKKNKRDLVLLHINGINNFSLYILIFSIPLLGTLFSFVFSIPLCYMYSFVFNNVSSPSTSCILFGINSWKMMMLSFITLLAVSIVESVLLQFLVIKGKIK